MGTVALKQLVYTSEAVIDTQAIVTSQFTEKIQQNNAELEVTGALIWRKQKFMQVIEGPSDSINRLFAKLLRDPRHGNLVLISERIISEREFPNWQMLTVDIKDQSVEKTFSTARINQRGSRILKAFSRGYW